MRSSRMNPSRIKPSRIKPSRMSPSRMNHGPGQWLELAVLALAAGLVMAACASTPTTSSTSAPSGGTNTASAPGITATSIRIGSHQPLTGIAAPGYSEIAPAENAMFADVNARGGVFGRTINYTYLDDGYNPSNTVSVVRQLALLNQVFAIFSGLGTPTHLSVVQYLNTERIPDLFVASGCDCWNNASQYPYTSGYPTDYTIEGKIMGQYIKQNFAGKKVAYFYQNDEFGLDGVKGLDQQILASSVVSRQHYDVPNPIVDPQVAALKASGAQVVVLYTVPFYTAFTFTAANKIGYHPQWVVSYTGSDPPTLRTLLPANANGLMEGVITDGYIPSVSDASNAWIQLFKRIHDQYIPNLPFDGNVEYGMSVAYTFVKLMQQAGRNPTRQSVIQTLTTANLAGPGLEPFAYSQTSRAGYTGGRMGKVSNGQLTLFGPTYTSTDSGPINVYTGGQPLPPPNL